MSFWRWIVTSLPQTISRAMPSDPPPADPHRAPDLAPEQVVWAKPLGFDGRPMGGRRFGNGHDQIPGLTRAPLRGGWLGALGSDGWTAGGDCGGGDGGGG